MPTNEERKAYLAEACQGDISLREAVEELLVAHEEESNLVDEDLMRLSSLRPYIDRAVNTINRMGSNGLDWKERDRTGERVGSYLLLEKIGEGGFGLVYEAQQAKPIRRTVAIKLLRFGVDSKGILARFEAERQALAIMNHPNIAHVFDAGTTSTGEPFFAMELVRGVSITTFCEEHQLGIRQRLELFTDVCLAVQHAHRKGIIHRDLKPSNIMVAMHDTKAIVKVIDFGVAKAIREPLSERTIHTRFMDLIGTPMYMSPEQAEMNSLDIDTRSDVFSLGMLLFEILTGSTPYDELRLKTVGFDELRRIIREEVVPTPSRRVSTPVELLSSVYARSGATASELRGDLDCIVMKAADKDRARRYESASDLARDIHRYLAHEPIEARPPSQWYLFTRFARRHKGTLTAVSLIVLVMILGSGVSLWQATRAAAERDEKEQAREEAVQARREVEELAVRIKDANGLLANGRARARSELWKDAAEDYVRAIELQPSYYFVWVERGAFYVRLGLWSEAATCYSTAMKLGAPVSGPEWWGGPQLLLFTGDELGYRSLCKQMWDESSSNDEEDPSVWAIRSCLFAVDPPVELEKIINAVERLPYWDRRRTLNSTEQFSGVHISKAYDKHPLAVRNYLLGLAKYRQGHYDEAVQALIDSQAEDRNWAGKPITFPVLAMAYFQIGQNDNALHALTTATKTLDDWTTKMLAGEVGSMPVPWFDYIDALLLYKEATILLTGSPPETDSRLEQLHQRAQGAIQ